MSSGLEAIFAAQDALGAALQAAPALNGPHFDVGAPLEANGEQIWTSNVTEADFTPLGSDLSTFEDKADVAVGLMVTQLAIGGWEPLRARFRELALAIEGVVRKDRTLGGAVSLVYLRRGQVREWKPDEQRVSLSGSLIFAVQQFSA